MQSMSLPSQTSQKIIYLDYLRIISCLGVFLFLSLKYSTVVFQGNSIPLGLFISDAFIGIAIFILVLNFVFLLKIP
jgi:hypothetical protein